MFKTLQEALYSWNDRTDGREKLQHAYVGVALVLVFVAGLIGLINYDLGQKILFVAIIALAMFLANAIAWALLQSFVLLRLDSRPKTTTRKK